MKGYMSFFLRMKQDAEGWKKANASSDNPTEDEKEKRIDELYTLNGNVARMRKELVQKNDVQRQIAKIYYEVNLRNRLWMLRISIFLAIMNLLKLDMILKLN